MIEIRDAHEADIPQLACYEAEIAAISFGDDAITDPSQHTKKLARALAKGGDIAMVATEGSEVVGWLWIAINTNMLTGEAYANFRSFALAPRTRGTALGRQLFEAALVRVRAVGGITKVVGKVHVSNMPMRLLYKELGFGPQHLTMELRI